MRQKMSQHYELSGAFWIVVFQNNWGYVSCLLWQLPQPESHELQQKSSSNAVSWGRSGNEWEIEELVTFLSSNLSRCVAWLLAAHFKDGRCLLQGRILLLHERCLLACAQAPCLEGDCDIWAAQVAPDLMTQPWFSPLAPNAMQAGQGT